MGISAQLRWAARVAAAVVPVVLAASCGSGGNGATLTRGTPRPTTAAQAPVPPRPSGVPADVNKPACDVLSPDDVSASLGNAVRPGTGRGKFCLWGTSVDGGSSANLTVNPPNQCDVVRRSLNKDGKSEPVGGLGESAVWNWRTEAILIQGDFVVCWSDAVVWITVSGEKDQSALRDAASSLAQKAHNKL